MKYGIVTRIGSESSKVNIAADAVKGLRLGSGTEFDVNVSDFLDQMGGAGLKPGRAARDFLSFAISVYVADTRIDRADAEDGWTREISISVPVKDSEAWGAAASSLQKALNFLTGDRWSLSFRASKAGLKLFNDEDVTPEAGALVSLFSGGLDSFIGTLDLLSTKQPLYLVGHYGFDPTASVSQAKSIKHVLDRRQKSQNVVLVNSRIAAKRDLLGWGNDNNERSRSLLFIAMGLLVADGVGASRMYIPENGLISLNVPLTTLRLGTYSTRTTHPHFISTLQNALAQLGIRIVLENPYRFYTKGEMLQNCKVTTDLLSMCADTMSCAHPSYGRYKHRPMTHCGRCTACIIRRAAFQKAFEADETDYILDDLTEKPLRSDLSSEGKDIRSIRLAAERVRNRPEQAAFLVLKPGPLPAGEHQRYADLYARGMEELWDVVKGVTTIGNV